MANIFGTRLLADPSFMEPDLIITLAQLSGYMDLLAGEGLRVKIGPADKFVYVNRIDLRGSVAAQQASANALPSSTIRASFIQTATYRIRTRANYSELDIQDAGVWNVALPEAQRLAMEQSIFQFLRVIGLYGLNAANNEGIVNAPGATAVTLPPDTFGNTTLETYDAGQMALFLLGQIVAAWTRMNMIGTRARAVLCAPQRVIATLEAVDIVQLTSFQRLGAGSATTAQEVKSVVEAFGYRLDYAVDDTLIGKGAAGDDLMILAVPEVIVTQKPGINTNVFASLKPNMEATILQYADVAAPVEVITPIPEGLDVVAQMRASSGWVLRPEAVSLLSIPFS